MDIELLATAAVKERLAYCVGLSPYVNERDKEPSWDGNIYVYPNKANKKAELIAKVPIQIKGKKKTISRKTNNLSFPACISDLRNYLNDGGVIYFVVALGDDRNHVIFYKSLLPFDLRKVLDKAGKAKTKNIVLHKLPDNDDAIRHIFLAFAADKKRQASQIVWTEKQAVEAVQNGATFKFHIQPKTAVKNHSEAIREATTQSFYLYVETKDGLEIPFQKLEEGCKIIANTVIEMPVYVGDTKYYDNIRFGYENGYSFIFIGDAIKIPFAEEGDKLKKRTFKYTLSGALTKRITDSDFILAVYQNKQFRIGPDITFDISLVNNQEIAGLRQLNDYFKTIKAALDYFGVHTDLDMSSLTDEDDHTINYLIRAVDGKMITFNEKDLPPLFYSNKKVGNIVVRLCAKKDENSDGYRLASAFSDSAHCIVKIVNEENHDETIVDPWSLFLHMKSEDFLCSNINYNVIFDSIKAMKPSDMMLTISMSDAGHLGANNMLLEIIDAYDSQEDKELLQFAIDVADLIYVKTNDTVALINKLQAIKRQRLLTNDEIAGLVSLRNKKKQTELIKCAVSILLNETEYANRLLCKLSEKEKRQILDYPLSRLLNKNATG